MWAGVGQPTQSSKEADAQNAQVLGAKKAEAHIAQALEVRLEAIIRILKAPDIRIILTNYQLRIRRKKNCRVVPLN